MRAAVVTSFDTPPICQDFATPTPRTPGEALVEVIAAGLHPRVRSQANGSHYTSSGELPLVPGIDGVGRAPDGTLRYFVLPDTAIGSMAERTVVDLRRSVVLPEGSDPILIAAAMNPAMSSWVALRRRIDFQPGQKVLVLGATGSAGRLAVQVAKHLGAGQVVGAGRKPARLAELANLGADTTVSLDDTTGQIASHAAGGPDRTTRDTTGATGDSSGATGDRSSHTSAHISRHGAADDVAERLGRVAGDVDVVIDYLWGQPAVDAITAIVTRRADREQPLTWIQIGSVAGPAAAIPSAALRAARLQIVGSGQGSVPARDILAELPDLAARISGGAFRIDARPVPLTDVEPAWKDTGATRRIVITP